MDQPPTSSRRLRRLELILLATGGGMLLLPGLLGVLFLVFPVLWPAAAWLHNSTLTGENLAKPGAFTWPGFLRARYQGDLEKAFDDGFPGRELLIRGINETYLRVFRTTGTASGEAVIVGRDRTLFPAGYLLDYCAVRRPPGDLADFTRQLARLQTACLQRGVAFALVISPSKASIYPEKIPADWLEWYDPRPRPYDDFIRLVAEHGIACVDGHALAINAKGTAPVPVFARGAVHWNPQLAFSADNALLGIFQKQGKPITPMEVGSVRYSDHPEGEEADLLALLNLAIPWKYRTVEVHVKPKVVPANSRLNVVFVGTSFTLNLATLLSECGQIYEADQFYFYRLYKCCFQDGQRTLLSTKLPPLDLEREVFSADALVLEINEAALAKPTFAREFVADALRHLKEPAPPREPFTLHGTQPYTWGQQLSFLAGALDRIAENTLTGFSGAEPTGTWTVQPAASVRLRMDSPADDLMLDAELGAMAVPELHSTQGAEVFVNGHSVGQWEFPEAAVVHRELPVPRRFLDGPRLDLGFCPFHPASPAELGIGGDSRRLGLRLASLRLRVAPAMPCRWGVPVFFGADTVAAGIPVDRECVTGLALPDPAAAWTEGAEATVRLRVPSPPEGDVILRVEAGAFLDPRLRPAARTAVVFANDESVAEWSFDTGEIRPLEARIPGRLLGKDGVVRLRVRIDHPTSPLEVGQSGDSRKLGLFLASVTLLAADDHRPEPDATETSNPR